MGILYALGKLSNNGVNSELVNQSMEEVIDLWSLLEKEGNSVGAIKIVRNGVGNHLITVFTDGGSELLTIEYYKDKGEYVYKCPDKSLDLVSVKSKTKGLVYNIIRKREKLLHDIDILYVTNVEGSPKVTLYTTPYGSSLLHVGYNSSSSRYKVEIKKVKSISSIANIW